MYHPAVLVYLVVRADPEVLVSRARADRAVPVYRVLSVLSVPVGLVCPDLLGLAVRVAPVVREARVGPAVPEMVSVVLVSVSTVLSVLCSVLWVH